MNYCSKDVPTTATVWGRTGLVHFTRDTLIQSVNVDCKELPDSGQDRHTTSREGCGWWDKPAVFGVVSRVLSDDHNVVMRFEALCNNTAVSAYSSSGGAVLLIPSWTLFGRVGGVLTKRARFVTSPSCDAKEGVCGRVDCNTEGCNHGYQELCQASLILVLKFEEGQTISPPGGLKVSRWARTSAQLFYSPARSLYDPVLIGTDYSLPAEYAARALPVSPALLCTAYKRTEPAEGLLNAPAGREGSICRGNVKSV